MKVLWVCCNETIAEDVMECLDSSGLKGYAVWKDMLQKDNVGDKTHWGDGVFPGKNWAFMTCGDEEKIGCAIKRLEGLRQEPYVLEAGLEAYVWEAESVFETKVRG